MPPRRPKSTKSTNTPSATQAKSYVHPEANALMRPDVGAQSEFRKKKPAATYKYDSSLAPELTWDGQNPARERGEALIREILDAKDLGAAQEAAKRLVAMSRPFLNWAGKAERLSFDVPTLPLFVHERLSTRKILESIKRHRSNQQTDAFELFGDPKHDYADQLRSYQHREDWVNRMILGDSLVVMNSLLKYEGMGGQVQMIYIDPPYGVKFGSNFQPFVRQRDVTHNDDADMTREPEMVQAYRDTWELGLHSYLTYLRDRLLVARDLLAESGSAFVQISDENMHHVRELCSEVFGDSNFVATIAFKKTGSLTSEGVSVVSDYLLWYARNRPAIKHHVLFGDRRDNLDGLAAFRYITLPDGGYAKIVADETFPDGAKRFQSVSLTSQHHSPTRSGPFKFRGKNYQPPTNRQWSVSEAGLNNLVNKGRVFSVGANLRFAYHLEDNPVTPLTNLWTDTGTGSFTAAQQYVVETATKVVQRCILMTTDPGDLVLDPTCGSGTTAYAAEQWGRRWITIDTSRVPLALARQRLLTATYPWYELRADDRGPAGGFAYRRKQNSKGEEVGGIVPHVTLKSIANDEPPAEEVLVDRPDVTKNITRVAGPFCVEATIPTPVDFDGDGIEDSGSGESYASFVDRMLEVLRRSPTIQLGDNRSVTLRGVRPPARALSLSAEATVAATAEGQSPTLSDAIDEVEERRGDRLKLSGKLVAIVFGPENGAVSDRLVFEASREAHMKGYTHLYVIGFAIQPNARELIEASTARGTIPTTYVNMTPDVMMGDLLKNMRSSQIFSVCGQPEISVSLKSAKRNQAPQFEVKLLGLDVFDPSTMDVHHKKGDDVPCWMLDTDYDDLCFRATQVFFPKTAAWDNLKRALKGDYDDSVWEHLRGDTSAPFSAPEGKQEFNVAVKVIDERGNELLVVKPATVR
jgi:adenine-specific DNA-methyltransferase